MAQIFSRSEIVNGTGFRRNVRFVEVTPDELGTWQELVIRAQEAAEGDSNDTEIEVLHEAVEFVCQFFGGEL